MSRGGGGGGGGKIAGLYDLEETLGSGHFAVVKLARHVFTGEKVAVKVIDKTKLDQVSRAHLFQEVRCMKLVQHPNVVRLYEVIDTQTKLYLILELGDGGDLYDYIMRHDKGLSEDLAREYFRQIVRAISYCHRLHVVHRDLKPENVVFFQKLGIVKLTDFGFSNKFCPGQKLETSCGSLAYSAPEILLGDSYDAPAVDVWSLGVILYMLVCGHAPFHEANDSETLTMIMDCKYTIPQHVSQECKALIGRMLVRQPDRRASLSQISCDPWLSKGSGGDSGGGEDGGLPLVCGAKLSEEEHALVLQKMVAGHIASKDQILEAVNNDEYNHITATYYLLAERMLRAHREEHEAPRRPEVLGVAPVPMGTPTPPRASMQPSVPSRGLLAPPSTTNTLLSVPRTPTDVPQRGRKCSIVREGEEEEDEEGAGGASRRGSRSEGRLHLLALHNATAPSTHTAHNTTNLSSAILKVNLDDENTRMRLGNAGMGSTTGWMSSMGVGKKVGGIGDGCRPRSAIEGGLTVNNNYPIPRIVKTPARGDAKALVNLPLPLLCEDEHLASSITQAATITIPIRGRGQEGGEGEGATSVFRTMPSPIRPLKHSLDDSALGPGKGEGSKTRDEVVLYQQQRRNKYHKTHRTTSCSSSDASDDDSEGRKKRTHKHINTPTHKEAATQRRDSHDDSSDSQEQGTVGGSGGGGGGGGQATTGGGTGGQGQSGEGGGKGGGGGSGGGGNLSRRHRGGRRAGETRLRESQSLNRITEVQEAADTVLPPQQTPPVAPLRQRGFLNPARLFNRRTAPPLPPPSSDAKAPTTEENKIPNVQFLTSPLRPKSRLEEKENCHKITNVVAEKHSFKKMRLLGRYLQVHKKLCLPRWPGLPGLLGGGGAAGRGGRLYKAQSCGSIVRDKITSAGASSLLLVNELCREKPIVLDTHRAHLKLLADMRNGHPHPDSVSHPAPGFSVCRVHLGDASKCCGMC